MSRKLLTGLVAVLAVAALGVGASSAGAAACTVNVLCNGSNEALRDDFTEPPETDFPGFGANIFGVNTAGPLRLSALGVFNENPVNDGLFGLNIDRNPLTSTTKCEHARGYVEFVDIQNAKNNVPEASPVYSDTAPGQNEAWPFSILSNHCATNPGQVIIERVDLFFPKLATKNITVSGTILGKYVQPGTTSKCPGGGIELTEAQKLLLFNGASAESKITGGAEGKAFICFVSSNNNLYPETGPKWEKFKDEKGSAEPGIWKD